MKFCTQCGAPVRLSIPAGDNLARHVCDACGTIHYQNPRLVVGCVPDSEGRILLCRRAIEPRDHIFSEFLENEEAYIRSDRWKFIYCSGKRGRRDGYVVVDPTPGRYKILFDLQTDPGEFHNVEKDHPDIVNRFQGLMLQRFRHTHPDARDEPRGLAS